MDDYTELAAAALGLPLSTPEEIVEAGLLDRFGLDLGVWSEVVDAMLPFTPQFPSQLVPGEMIQTFLRVSDDGRASQAMVKRIIPSDPNVHRPH